MSALGSDFRVPGEDLGQLAPISLGMGGALCAIAAALLLASTSRVAEADAGAERPVAALRVATDESRATGATQSTSSAGPASSTTTSSSLAPLVEAGCKPIRIAFESNAAAPGAGPRAELDRLAAWLGEHPSTSVLVHGHADALGTDDGNLRLSHMRAESVARTLELHGVSRERMTVRGYGAYQPVEGLREDAADNRRVVVHVRGECPRDFEEVIGP